MQNIIISKRKQIALAYEAGAYVVVVAKPIEDEDWLEYMKGGVGIAKQHQRLDMVFNYAVHGPSLKQRGMMMGAEYRKSLRLGDLKGAALMSDESLVRGTMTAMGWLLPGISIRAFTTSALDQAAAWARPIPEEQKALIAAVRELGAAMGLSFPGA